MMRILNIAVVFRRPGAGKGRDGVMTIKELYRLLGDYVAGGDGDMLIVLAKDAEGNSHSPLARYSVGDYVPRTTWSGDFVTTDSEGNDLPDDECNALCLEPTN
jgi:hypothetical protein